MGTTSHILGHRVLSGIPGIGVQVSDPRPVREAHQYRARTVKICVVGADLTAVGLGLVASFVLARRIYPSAAHGHQSASLLIGVIALPLWIAAFSRYRLYNARFVSIRPAELGRLVHASLAGTLSMAAVAFLTKAPVPRSWLVLCFPTVLAAACTERELVRGAFNRVRRSGRLLRRVVLVGANDEAAALCELTERSPSLGYRIVGVVDDGSVRQLRGHAVGGRLEDTLEVVRATGSAGVIIATTAVTASSSNRLVREMMDAGIHVEMSTSLCDIDAQRLVVGEFGGCPMMYIEPVRRGGWRAAAKRTFDVACSVAALLVMLPFLAAVAVAVMIDSPGGPFFSQVRVGRDGKPFSIRKFRTMVDGAESVLDSLRDRNEMDGPLFKLSQDPRVTRIGKFLRRFSIDELPQLWNVLLGEMSLVGPRPALFSEMDSWTPALRRSRLRARPGLTGMWQVSGRSNLSFSEYVRMDLYYVDNWSLWRDLAIVAKTIPDVLRPTGAY